jgi:hypothetical protein
MSGAWPKDATRLNRVYPIELARAIHFPTMFFFVAFVIVHVILVFATGALRNLNHMYAANDGDSWLGFAFFAGSIVVTVAIWFLARPIFLRPVAALNGKVSRWQSNTTRRSTENNDAFIRSRGFHYESNVRFPIPRERPER